MPVGGWHQHLISPATDKIWSAPVFSAKALIAQLDDAGIRNATLLSVAYLFGDDRLHIEDEQAKVQAENDWTSQQVSLYPQRLIGFCGVNPLRTYAIAELERCRKLPGVDCALKGRVIQVQGDALGMYTKPGMRAEGPTYRAGLQPL